MKNTKRMLILCVMMIALSSCSNKNNKSISTETSTPTDTLAAKITAVDPTKAPTESPTKESTETITPTKKTKKQSSTSLKEYLDDYTDSKTYHLLYDVALNKKSTTNMDDDITYMFSEDDAGKRILGEVVAYYSDFKKIKAKNTDDFLNKYISKYFPELSGFMKNAKIVKEDGYNVKAIEFNDYNITIMSSDEMDSLTFIITKAED